jgi:glycosyltransferase involved in cell wall biosynthesis
MRNPPTVAVCQIRLTHYRVPFFEALRTKLEETGIRLLLVHGQPAPSEVGRNDTGTLSWAMRVENRYLRVAGKDLVWQPLFAHAKSADLVVVTQENRIVSNYPLLARRGFGGPKVAYWGHGANLQSTAPAGLKERWKRYWLMRVDWWFAYTAMTVERVANSGFPRERITDLENAVDTTALADHLAAIEPSETDSLRRRLGWEAGRIGLYLGSLYADKRLDFLFEAADRLHAGDPAFRLLIVGDGPMRERINRACAERAWCAWVGAKTGRDKAMCLALADVLLNPGLVGLGILDSFVAGVPMVTTDCGIHSPEIAYLRQQENGLMTGNAMDAFVAGVRRVLGDEAYRSRLVAGCREAAGHYTIENMARNFLAGILKALAL